MSIPVLYDACVLYGNEVRDLLMRMAISDRRWAVSGERLATSSCFSLLGGTDDEVGQVVAQSGRRLTAVVTAGRLGPACSFGGERCRAVRRVPRIRRGRIRCVMRSDEENACPLRRLEGDH